MLQLWPQKGGEEWEENFPPVSIDESPEWKSSDECETVPTKNSPTEVQI